MSRTIHSSLQTILTTKNVRNPVCRMYIIRKSDGVVLYRYATRSYTGNGSTTYNHAGAIMWPTFSWAVDIDGGMAQLPSTSVLMANTGSEYNQLLTLYRNEVVFRLYGGDYSQSWLEADLSQWLWFGDFAYSPGDSGTASGNLVLTPINPLYNTDCLKSISTYFPNAAYNKTGFVPLTYGDFTNAGMTGPTLSTRVLRLYVDGRAYAKTFGNSYNNGAGASGTLKGKTTRMAHDQFIELTSVSGTFAVGDTVGGDLEVTGFEWVSYPTSDGSGNASTVTKLVEAVRIDYADYAFSAFEPHTIEGVYTYDKDTLSSISRVWRKVTLPDGIASASVGFNGTEYIELEVNGDSSDIADRDIEIIVGNTEVIAGKATSFGLWTVATFYITERGVWSGIFDTDVFSHSTGDYFRILTDNGPIGQLTGNITDQPFIEATVKFYGDVEDDLKNTEDILVEIKKSDGTDQEFVKAVFRRSYVRTAATLKLTARGLYGTTASSFSAGATGDILGWSLVWSDANEIARIKAFKTFTTKYALEPKLTYLTGQVYLEELIGAIEDATYYILADQYGSARYYDFSYSTIVGNTVEGYRIVTLSNVWSDVGIEPGWQIFAYSDPNYEGTLIVHAKFVGGLSYWVDNFTNPANLGDENEATYSVADFSATATEAWGHFKVKGIADDFITPKDSGLVYLTTTLSQVADIATPGPTANIQSVGPTAHDLDGVDSSSGWTNTSNAVDGNESTYATATGTGSATATLAMTFSEGSLPASYSGLFLTLKMKAAKTWADDIDITGSNLTGNLTGAPALTGSVSLTGAPALTGSVSKSGTVSLSGAPALSNGPTLTTVYYDTVVSSTGWTNASNVADGNTATYATGTIGELTSTSLEMVLSKTGSIPNFESAKLRLWYTKLITANAFDGYYLTTIQNYDSGLWTNPSNAVDNDDSTYARLTLSSSTETEVEFKGTYAETWTAEAQLVFQMTTGGVYPDASDLFIQLYFKSGTSAWSIPTPLTNVSNGGKVIISLGDIIQPDKYYRTGIGPTDVADVSTDPDDWTFKIKFSSRNVTSPNSIYFDLYRIRVDCVKDQFLKYAVNSRVIVGTSYIPVEMAWTPSITTDAYYTDVDLTSVVAPGDSYPQISWGVSTNGAGYSIDFRMRQVEMIFAKSSVTAGTLAVSDTIAVSNGTLAATAGTLAATNGTLAVTAGTLAVDVTGSITGSGTVDHGELWIDARAYDGAAWTDYAQVQGLFLNTASAEKFTIDLHRVWQPVGLATLTNKKVELRVRNTTGDFTVDLYSAKLEAPEIVGGGATATPSTVSEGGSVTTLFVSVNGGKSVSVPLYNTGTHTEKQSYRADITELVSAYLYNYLAQMDIFYKIVHASTSDVETRVYEVGMEFVKDSEQPDRIFVSGKMTKDDASGTYTGTPGALIQKSSDIAQHVFRKACGLDVAMLNTSAMAALRGTDINLAFQITDQITGEELIGRLAWHRGAAAVIGDDMKLKWIVKNSTPVHTLTDYDIAFDGIEKIGIDPNQHLFWKYEVEYAYNPATGDSIKLTDQVDNVKDKHGVFTTYRPASELWTNDVNVATAIKDRIKSVHSILPTQYRVRCSLMGMKAELYETLSLPGAISFIVLSQDTQKASPVDMVTLTGVLA